MNNLCPEGMQNFFIIVLALGTTGMQLGWLLGYFLFKKAPSWSRYRHGHIYLCAIGGGGIITILSGALFNTCSSFDSISIITVLILVVAVPLLISYFKNDWNQTE